MSDLSSAALAERLRCATSSAVTIGRRVLELQQCKRWADPAVLGDIGDQAADAFLSGALRQAFPDDGWLSEEARDDGERLRRRGVWIVDPLDGTRDYRAGGSEWAVQVGFVVDGRPVFGVLALPAIDRTLIAGVVSLPDAGSHGGSNANVDADRGTGATVPVHAAAAGGAPIAVRRADALATNRPLRIAVSRHHAPPFAPAFAAALGGAELVPSTGVGFKVSQLLFDRADLFVHAGGLQEWDVCAPVVVAAAAGWTVTALDGSPLCFNRPDPRQTGLVVCPPTLSAKVAQALIAAAAR